MTTTRQMSALMTAGALALTLSACSDDGGVQEAGDAPADAAADTAADTGAGSESASASEPATEELVAGSEVDSTEFVERLKSPGNDVLGSFELTMDLQVEGTTMTMEGAADLRGDDPAMDLTMDVPQMGEVQLLLVEGNAYMSMPGVTEAGSFVEVPMEDLVGTDFTSQIDLTSQWDAWEKGAEEITFIGMEDVDGEQMEHYEVTVDSQIAMEAAGESAGDLGGATLPDTVSYDVWVDDSDLMRKVTFDIMGSTTEMTMDNWGEDVNIEAPDPANLQEIPGFTP